MRLTAASKAGSSFGGDLGMADTDPWPIDLFQLIPDQHAHALGFLVNHYNRAENRLFQLVDILLKNEAAARRTINHRLNNNDRLDLLRQLAEERSSEERDHILHAVQCFDICAENRNILMHAMIEETGEAPESFAARKRHATKAGVEIRFDLPLETLRKAADQTAAIFYYLMALHLYLVMTHPAFRPPPTRPPALPHKPQKPDKLNLRLPP